MTTGSVSNAVIGGYFLLVGLVMIFFRKQVLAFHNETVGRLPWGWHKVFSGATLIVIITVFGVLSVLGGITLLLLSIV